MNSRRGVAGQRGSALVIAMLVTVILALLGISFLLLAETENQMARNEKRAAQTLYAAEAGLRAVTRWFDGNDAAMHFPDPAVVDRTLRRIIDEADPYDPSGAVAADGLVGSRPYFKQEVDLDGDGADDLFRRPYRGESRHSLLGTRDGPDMRIDDGTPAGAAFLAGLSATLLADHPGEPGGVLARISRIDFLAPPYAPVGSTWRRYGMGTVRVTARIYRDPDGARDVLGEHTVEAVLSETPYRAPHAPLHSCGKTSFVPRSGETLSVRWGAISSVGDVRLTTTPGDFSRVPRSLPRDLPYEPGADQLWPADPAEFDALAAALDGRSIDDPWFRVVSAGAVFGAPSGTQPYPPSSTDPDHSNLIQRLPLVVCPNYDYATWKGIAQSGFRGVHYYVYAGSSTFREQGAGPARSFQAITDGAEGLFFFDTADSRPPADADADGLWDNLTPAITVTGGWRFKGFLFLNAASFRADGLSGIPTTVRPPGEPFRDVDLDGEHDADEKFVNLVYPGEAAAVTEPVVADTSASGAPRDDRGPAIADIDVAFQGILFNTGYFEATGSGIFYGSVVALQGVTQTPADGSAETPTLLWDESIAGDWPPDGWDLPRVVITEWDTGG